jgi:hypothetical protein
MKTNWPGHTASTTFHSACGASPGSEDDSDAGRLTVDSSRHEHMSGGQNGMGALHTRWHSVPDMPLLPRASQALRRAGVRGWAATRQVARTRNNTSPPRIPALTVLDEEVTVIIPQTHPPRSSLVLSGGRAGEPPYARKWKATYELFRRHHKVVLGWL